MKSLEGAYVKFKEVTVTNIAIPKFPELKKSIGKETRTFLSESPFYVRIHPSCENGGDALIVSIKNIAHATNDKQYCVIQMLHTTSVNHNTLHKVKYFLILSNRERSVKYEI